MTCELVPIGALKISPSDATAPTQVLAARQQDTVGLVAFDENIRAILPPKASQLHLEAIAQTLNANKPQQKTDPLKIFKRIADLHRTYLFFAIIISIPMFFMGFTHEVFYVGKPDAVLCMMLGFFTGLAYCARNQKGRLLEVVTPVNGPFVMLSRAAKTILRRPTIAG